MKFKDNTKKIKKALLQGGLVVSGRNTGKTKALAEILSEIPEAVVVVGQEAQASRLKMFLREIYHFSNSRANLKVINSCSKRALFIGYPANFASEYVYVDEFYLNPYKGLFKAAVTSFPFLVKVSK